ncbi:MAG: leucyl aminopeptidase [Alphaproteobacteria bacterium]|nr:leucyl aminopeptidase [Alphaproteobacteria bacterium]MCL2504866.1 leucyl aminopeptidase [Alphaproteobacteria bacterium]
MQIQFSKNTIPSNGTVVILIAQEAKAKKASLGKIAKVLDKKLGGGISKAIKTSRFDAAQDKILEIIAPANTKLSRIVLLGIGSPLKATAQTFKELGGGLTKILNNKTENAFCIVDDIDVKDLHKEEIAANIGMGALLGAYKFDKYKTKKKDEKPELKELVILTEKADKAKAHYATLSKVAEGVLLARDLVNEPSNVMTPIKLANEAAKLKALGVVIEVLDEKKMQKLGMEALLGVGKGSAHPPRLVAMFWNGKKTNKKADACFVGKGVTFDSGGISLKPGNNMEAMKGDMAGAAVVIGVMKALAGRKAKVNIAGVIGTAENMPSGTAIKPGDVVKTASGKTVAVLNTDAEGRLVLADALWYAQKKFKPDCIIDIATLTGGMLTTFGNNMYAGLFSNDDTLSEELTNSGKKVGEKLWRLPTDDVYDKMIDSPIADMQNMGNARGASGTVGAKFIERFVDKGVKWAHVDIAEIAWNEKGTALSPKWATAFGVRLLDSFAADYIEKKHKKK